MPRKKPAPAGVATVVMPPMPFSLTMNVRVPTQSGQDWEGSLAKLFEIDFDNPGPQLTTASGLAAFWAQTRAECRKQAIILQDVADRAKARLKIHFLKHGLRDESGERVQMSETLRKDAMAAYVEAHPDYIKAVDALRVAECKAEIADSIMWECKAWHKDLQILTAAKQQETGVERSTPPSVDPGRTQRIEGRRRGSGTRPEPLTLGDQPDLSDTPEEEIYNA